MEQRDWLAWHQPYRDPASPLSRRLATVQQHLRRAIDARAERTVAVLSVCAGQGHDVIGVLGSHPRSADVRATLVELDPRNVALARIAAADIGLSNVEIRRDDAGETGAFQGATPADVLLVCGVFGNITDADIEHTIGLLPSLCAPDATVIWTRHRRPPDLTPSVRRWFAAAGFVEEAFHFPDDVVYGVGVHHLHRDPDPFVSGRRMFAFVGYDALLSDEPPGGGGGAPPSQR